MTYDIHNHFLPEPFVELLLEWETPVGLESDGEQLFAVHQRSGTSGVAGGNRIPLSDGFTDMAVRLEWMDDHGIERTAVSVSTPNPLDESFSDEQTTQLIRAINDGYADVQSRYPDRFIGLGMLPLREPEEALAELDRIATELDLRGIALPTSINGTKLSIPELEPVFDRLDELGLPAFVHPHGNRLSDTLNDDESFLNPLVIFPTETTFQITRLIYDGFFDDHEFDVILSHMGGALHHLVGRLERARDTTQEANTGPQRPIEEYVERFYYDAISFHRPAMEAAIETVGPEQFVFGTDYPFHEADIHSTRADLEAVFTEDEQEAVLSTTAERLFD
ncbi:amidohydrolase family protein [Natrarchaeobius sp. A-rgal3]|uniref:amidohydrolase family protein n=1 Tax=Natrarchaeobius versutus TaxID=1679078 RepID=UPI00350F7545